MRIVAERFIVPEEAMLETAFGRAYEEYKAAVRRWL
jgi:protein-S-isoprenylcysteine O-methyltransferase Ste14